MAERILYIQYTNPANYPPLEHSGLLLLGAGREVAYFGIQSDGESNKLVFPGELARRQTLWPRSAPGPRQKLHFIRFTLRALGMVLARRTGWVYCSDLLSCPAAWLIGRLTRCRVLYHEHDSPDDGSWPTEGGQHAQAGLTRFQRFLLWTRRQVGRRAELVVLPNQTRLDRLVKATGRQGTSLCVFNCPRRGEDRIRTGEDATPGILRLAFHGSINRDRLPMTIIEAMSRFPGRIHLSVVGYETVGSAGYMAGFLAAAERLGLAGQVEFFGALATRRELLDQAAQCHVGLAFMPLSGGDVNMANMTGASNKPFDYLACELALLVSARPDWEAMFVVPGFGRACDPGNVDSMARQLEWFLEQAGETREMGRRGRHKILSDWNYEAQFDQVMRNL